MRKWLTPALLALATGLTINAETVAFAQNAPRAVRADARTEVATAVYAAAAAQFVAQRQSDARLSEAYHQIEQLRSQGDSAREQLTRAQENYVTELTTRDHEAAVMLAAYRNDVTDIASTSGGADALAKINAGQTSEGFSLLDRIAAARARAEQAAADVRKAVLPRQIANIALQKRREGEVDIDTVIARFEAVTTLDASLAQDWITLGALYEQKGLVAKARDALARGLATQATDTERATLNAAMGELFYDESDLAQAQSSYQTSQTLAAQLTRANPDDTKARQLLAEALHALSLIAEARGDTAGAKSLYDQGSAIIDQAVAVDPTNTEAQLSAASFTLTLIDRLVERGDREGAADRIDDYLNRLDALQTAHPRDVVVQSYVARGLFAAGMVYSELDYSRAALSAISETVNIYADLRAIDPGYASYTSSLASAFVMYGGLILDVNETEPARRMLLSGIALFREMRVHDPADGSATEGLFQALKVLLSTYSESAGEPAPQALESEALAIVRAATAQYPTSVGWQSELGQMLFLSTTLRQRTPAEADALTGEGLAAYRRAATLAPDDPETQLTLAAALRFCADLADTHAQAPAAARQRSESQAILRRVAAAPTTSVDTLEELSRNYFRLGHATLRAGAKAQARAQFDDSLAAVARMAATNPASQDLERRYWERLIAIIRVYADADALDEAASYVATARTFYRPTQPARRNLIEGVSRLSDLADIFAQDTQLVRARALHEEAAAVYWAALPSEQATSFGQRASATALLESGLISLSLHDDARAQETAREAFGFARAFGAAERIGDRRGVGRIDVGASLNRTARLFQKLGLREEALSANREAFAVLEEVTSDEMRDLNDVSAKAVILRNLSDIGPRFVALGDDASARAVVVRAEAIVAHVTTHPHTPEQLESVQTPFAALTSQSADERAYRAEVARDLSARAALVAVMPSWRDPWPSSPPALQSQVESRVAAARATLARGPADAASARALAQSLVQLGDIVRQTRPAEAGAFYHEAALVLARMVRPDGSSAAWRAAALYRAGLVDLAANRYRAEDDFAEAVRAAWQALLADPGARDAQYNFAFAEVANGRVNKSAGARAWMEAAARLRTLVAQDPSLDLLLAEALRQTDRAKPADRERDILEAIAITERHHPQDLPAHLERARCWLALSDMHADNGEAPKAGLELDNAFAALASPLGVDTASHDAADLMEDLFIRRAQRAFMAGDVAGARRSASERLVYFQRRANQRGGEAAAPAVLRALEYRAVLAREAGDLPAMRADLTQGLALAERLAVTYRDDDMIGRHVARMKRLAAS